MRRLSGRYKADEAQVRAPAIRGALAKAILSLVIVSTAAVAGSSPYPFVVPLEPATSEHADLSKPLRLALYTTEPTRLAGRLGDLVEATRADHVVVRTDGYPQLPPHSPETFRQATFLIDFEERSVAELRADFVASTTPTVSARSLSEYVATVLQPRPVGGFDVASRTATNRSGDCTEHAVLFVALARSLGMPARVALGTVVVSGDRRIGAFGHAWGEVYDEGRWAVIDATEMSETTVHAYLPTSVVTDEGTGYQMGLAANFLGAIERIVVLGPVGNPTKAVED